VALLSPRNSDISSNSISTSSVQKTDSVQERINRINEIFTEDSAFEKAEKFDTNSI
jgi:hypothetical protein